MPRSHLCGGCVLRQRPPPSLASHVQGERTNCLPPCPPSQHAHAYRPCAAPQCPRRCGDDQVREWSPHCQQHPARQHPQQQAQQPAILPEAPGNSGRERVSLPGFGAGMTWGSQLVTWELTLSSKLSTLCCCQEAWMRTASGSPLPCKRSMLLHLAQLSHATVFALTPPPPPRRTPCLHNNTMLPASVIVCLQCACCG